MTTLRATRKLLRYLGSPTTPVSQPGGVLGDWFANRFVLDRQPLLIFVSSVSLLPILEPARQVRTLPSRLPSIVRRRLTEIGIDHDLVAAEIRAMGQVLVAPTNDRSVLGIMNEFVLSCRFYESPERGWNRRSLTALEQWLEQTPCRATRPRSETVFPADLTRELLTGCVN